MYTIHVNDCPLRLVSTQAEAKPSGFTLRYPGKPKFFLQITGTLEGGAHPDGITVTCPDVEQAWEDFKKHFNWVPAAGGLVANGKKLLCIHRLGRWDLPKGKIDPGESNSEAAVREVQEETGIQDMLLGRPLTTTYHTYYTKKGKRVLKPTYWFAMRTQQDVLTPEVGEGITEARWVKLSELDDVRSGMYPSLHSVLDEIRANPPRRQSADA